MANSLLHPFHPSRIPFTSESFILPSQPNNDPIPSTTQVRPSVPPGFSPLQPNTNHSAAYQLFGSSNCNAALPAQSYQTNTMAMPMVTMNHIQMIANVYEELQKEVVRLKKQSGMQAGSINWMKEEVRSYEDSKITISNLEGNMVQLANHAQAVENSYVNMLLQVESVVEENKKLGSLAGDLKEELGQVRRVLKRVCVGGAIIGVIGMVVGVIKWIK